MSLLEEINLRVEAYGGREAVIRALDKEWSPVPEFMFKNRSGAGGNNTHPLWTLEECKILAQGIEDIALKINKSRQAVRNKMRFEGLL